MGLSPAPDGWREEGDEDEDAADLELGLELELERELEGVDADFCFLDDGGLMAGGGTTGATAAAATTVATAAAASTTGGRLASELTDEQWVGVGESKQVVLSLVGVLEHLEAVVTWLEER